MQASRASTVAASVRTVARHALCRSSARRRAATSVRSTSSSRASERIAISPHTSAGTARARRSAAGSRPGLDAAASGCCSLEPGEPPEAAAATPTAGAAARTSVALPAGIAPVWPRGADRRSPKRAAPAPRLRPAADALARRARDRAAARCRRPARTPGAPPARDAHAGAPPPEARRPRARGDAAPALREEPDALGSGESSAGACGASGAALGSCRTGTSVARAPIGDFGTAAATSGRSGKPCPPFPPAATAGEQVTSAAAAQAPTAATATSARAFRTRRPAMSLSLVIEPLPLVLKRRPTARPPRRRCTPERTPPATVGGERSKGCSWRESASRARSGTRPRRAARCRSPLPP